jgi:type I restriction enzyme S subunit
MEAFADTALPTPPLEEQRRIADFLDAETTRIDTLVSNRSRAIDIMVERRSAVIRAALHGDSSQRRSGAHTKIPWLTSYPSTWDAVPIRYLGRVQRGASPRPIDDPIYFDENGTHGWVRISDVTASDKYLTHTTQRLSALGKSHSVPMRPGELFVSIAGSVGKPIIADIPCCIHDGFVAIRNPHVDPEFIYYVLLLGDAFRGLGKLGTQLNLNSETVGSIIVPVPPKVEQETIVRQLNAQLDFMGRLRDTLVTQVELLAERRQALITAAVTGQIDVTTAKGVDVS